MITNPEDTAPTIVPSPSLDSVEMIAKIGIESGGIILEGDKSLGDGALYDDRNFNGECLWKAVRAEDWAVKPNVAIPEGFPTLVVPVGTI